MKGWTTMTLERVTIGGPDGLRRGPFGSAITKASFVPDGYKIYEQKHAIYGDFEAGAYFIGETQYLRLKSFAIATGDMIVSCSGTLGRIAIVPPTAKPGIINQALLRIRPKSDIVSPVFLKRLLETPELQSSLFGSAGGSAIKNVRPLSAIRGIEFSLPPLAEQRRIAEVLDRAEALRAKRRAALAQLDSLTQSIFLDLFGDPGTNPKGWPIRSVGELCKVKGGKRLPKSEEYSATPTAFRYIRVTDLVDGIVDETALVYLKPEVQAKIARYVVNTGDVIISIAGSIGLIAPVPATLDGVNLTENAAKLVPRNKESYDAAYLATLLQTPFVKNQISSHIGQVTIGKLALFRIEKLKVPLPPISLQREFVVRRDSVEKVKAAQRASLAEMDALFNSLQHRAFRGEL